MTFKTYAVLGEEEETIPGKLDRSRLVVVNKFKRQRAAARAANAPEPDVARVRYQMQLAELEALRAGNAAPAFRFNAEDVASIDTEHDGAPGTFFRLHNGRLFNSAGERIA